MRIDNFIKCFTNNKTLMNGTLFSVFSFFNKGIGFILLILLAKYIVPAEYGRLSLFNTVVQFLGYFIALSSQGYFGMSYFQRKGDLFRQDFTSMVLILTICTSFFAIVLLVSQNTLAKLVDIPPTFLWIALAICFIQFFFNCYIDLLRIQEKVIRYGIVSCGFALISFAITIFLVVNKNQGWGGRVYAQLICTIIFGLLGFTIMARKKLFTRHVTWNGTKVILLWAIPLIPHEATSWIKQGCDRFIINNSHSIEDVGVFSFALTLTSIIIMIGTAFNSTNSVTIYQILSSDSSIEEKKYLLKRQTRNIALIYTVGYFIVLVVGSLLIPFVLPKYLDSLPYFWITSISGFMSCVYFLYVNYLFYYHKNTNLLKITFFTAVLHLILSLLLTRFSLFFTAIIYVLTQAIVLLLVWRRANITLNQYLSSTINPTLYENK